MTDFKTPESLREHHDIATVFKTLKDSAKFQADTTLMDEVVSAVSIAKGFRETADNMRLPKRYKTEEDLHDLAIFFVEAQAKRDRVIEIKLDFLPLRASLARLWDRCHSVVYQYEVIYKITPAPRREAMIKYVLEPLRERMAEVDMIIEAATEAASHLKDAYFTLRELKGIGTTYIEGQREQKGI